MYIMIVTARLGKIESFLSPLKQMDDAKILIVQNGAIALEEIKSAPPTFTIIDEGLPDFEPLALVTEILKINAMINTVAVSSLTSREFHDASEGLGILTSIPPTPKEEDGIRLSKLFVEFS